MGRGADISEFSGMVPHPLQMFPEGEDKQEENCQEHSKWYECEYRVSE